MFKLNAKFDADSLLYSLSHFKCNGPTVHMFTQRHLLPNWLVQWAHHCLPICIAVHSPWLPHYTDVAQTILVLLTMAGLFWTDHIYHKNSPFKFSKIHNNVLWESYRPRIKSFNCNMSLWVTSKGIQTNALSPHLRLESLWRVPQFEISL